MSNLSAFNTLGPIMVGPSSSHTAGAVRIGNLAKEIVGNKLKEIKIYLHGSFKETYHGHGTDKALIGGLLGFSTENDLIKRSFEIAKEQGIQFEFYPIDLDNVHPNTLKLEITDSNKNKTTIVASSIGGGSVVVTKLNNIKVELKGEYYTLITRHQDQPGMIAKISKILQEYDLNIAKMKVLREKKGSLATAIIDLDQKIKDHILELIAKIPQIKSIKLVNPIE
ncbi:L-serine ammonia-lyase, iron-sulfur-dependent subunit beta [Halanaerobaculum tunisiense]